MPDGVYRPLVHLRHRTILMPNRIRVDTKPPQVRLRSLAPRVLEPGKRLRVRYLLDEPARVYVFLNGRRVVLGRSTRRAGRSSGLRAGGRARTARRSPHVTWPATSRTRRDR